MFEFVKANLVYHFVVDIKQEINTDELKAFCKDIELRYEWIHFESIERKENQMHFIIRSIPDYSPDEIIQKIKTLSENHFQKDMWDEYIVFTMCES